MNSTTFDSIVFPDNLIKDLEIASKLTDKQRDLIIDFISDLEDFGSVNFKSTKFNKLIKEAKIPRGEFKDIYRSISFLFDLCHKYNDNIEDILMDLKSDEAISPKAAKNLEIITKKLEGTQFSKPDAEMVYSEHMEVFRSSEITSVLSPIFEPNNTKDSVENDNQEISTLLPGAMVSLITYGPGESKHRHNFFFSQNGLNELIDDLRKVEKKVSLLFKRYN